jgi:dienelactone hydrolase
MGRDDQPAARDRSARPPLHRTKPWPTGYVQQEARIEPITTQPPTERDGARIHDVRVADADAYLVEPTTGGRGPGLLFLHWFDTEAPDGNRSQFIDEAVALARDEGFVSILPQGQFPWAGDPTDAASDAGRIRDEVTRHRAALDHLVTRNDVDEGRIGLVGHDFGGMHGILVAAEDARIAAAVVIAATPRWADWFLPFWKIDGDRFDYLRALCELDPVSRIGDLAPRPVLLQFARNDFFIAAMSGLELHRAAGEPKEMLAYESDHGVREPQARIDRREFLLRTLAPKG